MTSDEFPEISTDAQPRDILEQAILLLLGGNDPPCWFRQNGYLVKVVVGSDGPYIERVTAKALYKRLVNSADWVRNSGAGTKPSGPPSSVVQAILEDPHEGFPELDGLTSVPVFGCGWETVFCPGYDRGARIYFVGGQFPLISSVSEMDSESAGSLLLESICDFPFLDEASRSHALGLMLLPFVRAALGDAPTPLHVIESPTPGSGKGRLADLISVIATGSPCRPTSLSSSKSENAKKLTSILVSGAPLILLDNLPQERVLNDPVLASMLTSSSPSERLLGQNRIVNLKNRAVWMATANNPQCTLELARRCVRIRLDPQQDRPWLRNEFLHPDLLGWARSRRSELVGACLSLVSAWLENGRPGWTGRILGSFEIWSSVIGGILAEAGIDGFLANLEEVYRDSDGESEEWRQLIELWWGHFGRRPLKASEICDLCLTHGLLEAVIGFGAARSQVSRLGRALQRNADRVFGGLKLLRDRTAVQSSARYFLLEVRPKAEGHVMVSRDKSTHSRGKV